MNRLVGVAERAPPEARRAHREEAVEALQGHGATFLDSGQRLRRTGGALLEITSHQLSQRRDALVECRGSAPRRRG